jgi:hypothetical protein
MCTESQCVHDTFPWGYEGFVTTGDRGGCGGDGENSGGWRWCGLSRGQRVGGARAVEGARDVEEMWSRCDEEEDRQGRSVEPSGELARTMKHGVAPGQQLSASFVHLIL